MTDYGIVLLSHFAKDESRTQNARDLAYEARLPLPTVSKILKSLSRGEVLISQRGVKGGYRLARRASEITIAQVIQTLEGPIAMTECSSHAPGVCDFEARCPVRSNWRKINEVVRSALINLTLLDMTRQ